MIRGGIRSTLVLTLAILVVAPVAHALVTPAKVHGDQGSQFYPFANDDFLIFTDDDGPRYAAMAKRRATGFTFRLNETGTWGGTGGIDPGTDTAILQQFDPAADRSAIYLFDLGDRERRLAPGVNSPAWEWDPRISARFISVFRNRTTNGVAYVDVYLFRRDTESLRRITSLKRKRFTSDGNLYLWNGSVTDDYATWNACTASDDDCDAYVYDISERTTKVVSGGGNKQEFAGAVGSDGFIYFGRSGNACGRNVAIWRLPVDHLAATPTKVVALPDGYDAGFVASVAVNGTTGGTDYYFERGKCSNWTADIYVARRVDEA